MKTFINCSNHPYSNWDAAQTEEALKYGKIVDVPFPAVDPEWDEKMIAKKAAEVVDKILGESPAVVMCQGEFTLCYAIINMLKGKNVPVVAACSERRTVEQIVDGKTVKFSEFSFIKFREY